MNAESSRRPPLKALALWLAIGLLTAPVAHAQSGGGGHGGRGGRSQSGSSSNTPSAASAPAAVTPLDAIEIIGVIQAIDRQNQRLTIAYEPVDALNWPKGSMPFAVSRTGLMEGLTVGEKVRFKLQSQQISDLAPYEAKPSLSASDTP